MSISQIPSGWTITRSDERIVVQHVSGSFYAAAKEGDSGIAESILYMLADSLLNATISPAHIEDGEEVEVVGYRSGTSGHIYAESYGLERPEPLMTVAQHQRILAALSADNHRVIPPEPILAAPHPMAALAAPPAAGTTSDQYRAELYDEVWQKARDLGYGNVTDALVELERIKAAPPAAGVPEDFREARVIGFRPGMGEVTFYVEGGVPGFMDIGQTIYVFAAPTPPASKQQHYGRIPSDSRNRMWELIDAALLGTVPDGLKRGDICNILAPLFASEQQRAEADLLNMIDQHRIELLPEYDAGYTAIAYCAQTEPIAEAVAMTARAALEELAKKLQSAAPPQENDR